MKQKNILIVFGLVIAAIVYRFLPHPANFSPVNSIFLFSGALLAKKYWKIALVFGLVFLSDFLLNNTLLQGFFSEQSTIIWFAPYMIFNYVSFALIIGVGYLISHKKISHVFLGALASSVIFFLLTNAGAWMFDPMGFYPNGVNGLMMSITAGLPFFHWTVISDLLFSGVLFGLFWIANNSFSLQTQKLRN